MAFVSGSGNGSPVTRKRTRPPSSAPLFATRSRWRATSTAEADQTRIKQEGEKAVIELTDGRIFEFSTWPDLSPGDKFESVEPPKADPGGVVEVAEGDQSAFNVVTSASGTTVTFPADLPVGTGGWIAQGGAGTRAGGGAAGKAGATKPGPLAPAEAKVDPAAQGQRAQRREAERGRRV